MKLVKLLSLFSTDTSSSYELIYFSVLIVGVYLSSLYQNGITSLTIDPAQQKVLQYLKLKDVLDHGFKLLWEKHSPSSPRYMIGWAFREYKILDALESSFHFTNGDPLQSFYIHEKDSIWRYALKTIHDKHAIHAILTAVSRNGYEQRLEATNCFVIPKPIISASLYWLIETISRPWVMLSMHSGLR